MQQPSLSDLVVAALACFEAAAAALENEPVRTRVAEIAVPEDERGVGFDHFERVVADAGGGGHGVFACRDLGIEGEGGWEGFLAADTREVEDEQKMEDEDREDGGGEEMVYIAACRDDGLFLSLSLSLSLSSSTLHHHHHRRHLLGNRRSSSSSSSPTPSRPRPPPRLGLLFQNEGEMIRVGGRRDRR